MARNFNRWMRRHPGAAQKYNQLGQDEQSTYREKWNANPRDARKWARGMLGAYPHNPGDGPHVNPNTDMEDPSQVINQASNVNQQTQNMNMAQNRVNQEGPMGSSEYTYDPQSNTYTRKYSMGQTGDNLLNQVNQNSQQLPWNTDFAAENQKATQAAYNQFENLAEPGFQKQTADFNQSMADQGITQGSQAFNQRYQPIALQQEGARLQAQNQAIQTGTNTQATLFNQALQSYNAPLQALNSYANANKAMTSGYDPTYTNTQAPVDAGQIFGQYAGYQNTLNNTNLQGGWNLAAVNAAGNNALALQSQGFANNAQNNTPTYNADGSVTINGVTYRK